ncbi:MAG: hypothetical protein AMXMBFR4_16930 [Candidatus Hydrogenedentota bacterium]
MQFDYLIVVRLAYSAFTLYMLLILLRWLGPYLELDFYSVRLRWVARAVDPFVRIIRRRVPALGPMDAGPLLALLVVWVARELTVGMLVAGAT